MKDDLNVITLERPLIVTPPVVLWPIVAAQGIVPSDVQMNLLAALHS